MSQKELEISLLEITNNIKEGGVPPFEFHFEQEDKNREDYRLDLSRNISELERRKLFLKDEEGSQYIEAV